MRNLRYLIIVWLIPIICYGAVDNVVVSDGSYIITGSDFGEKTPAEPLLFEQFEDNVTSGTEISAVGSWDGETASIVYDSSDQRTSDSTFKIVDTLTYGGENGSAKRLVFPDEVGIKYVSLWERDTIINNNPQSYWQHKTFRVSAGPEHGDYPTLPYEVWWNTDYTLYQDLFSNQGMSCGGFYGLNPEPISNPKWHRVTIILKDSTFVDGDDGYFIGRYDIPGIRTTQKNNTNCSTRTANYPNTLRWLKIGYYITNNLNSGHQITSEFDDIYVDNTLSRVALGDSSDFDECTHIELQPPTLWSNTSITVTINRGSFKVGDQAYLFVIDSNGNISNGYPITIEQSSITRADVNQDNQITSTDALLTLRKSLNLDMSQTNWQDSPTTGDVNCDNTTNSTDAMLILRKSLGLNMGSTDWCVN